MKVKIEGVDCEADDRAIVIVCSAALTPRGLRVLDAEGEPLPDGAHVSATAVYHALVLAAAALLARIEATAALAGEPSTSLN